MSPSLVLITATSFDELMGVLSSFFSSAAKTAELNITMVSNNDFIEIGNGELLFGLGRS
jgi:hypothetical protein